MAAAQPPKLGFVLHQSGPGAWDEIFLARELQARRGPIMFTPEQDAWVAYTTTQDGSDFLWFCWAPAPGQYVLPRLAPDGSRTAPAGVPAAKVTWMCNVEDNNLPWLPTAPELIALLVVAEEKAREVSAALAQGQVWPLGLHVTTAGTPGPYPA